MAAEHELTRTDCDLGALADQLLARLGAGVSVQVGDAWLRVLDVGGNPLDVDPVVVAAVIAAHTPPARPVPLLQVLTAGLERAATVEDLRTALLGWARAEAAATSVAAVGRVAIGRGRS